MKDKEFIKNIRNEEKNFLEAPIYLYGTEAIGSYYSLLNLNGKSVLTINGSGDQVLNALFFGAKRVVGFDLLESTKYMLNLKIAALKEFNLEEFLSFFGNTHEAGDFNCEKYNLLKKHLDEETINFFDELFNKYDNDGTKLINSEQFRKRKEFYSKLYQINPFLANKQNYQKMRDVIASKKPGFIESDIHEIHKKITEKFDLINLSNVLNYISQALIRGKSPNPLEHINSKILLNLKSLLNKGGKIIFYYFYRSLEEVETTPLINKDSTIQWLMDQKDFTISRIDFEGILHGNDAVTVLSS